MTTLPRWMVGIDLGTTNTVVAAADAHDPARRVSVFAIPQQVTPGSLEPLERLPSARYHAAPEELPEAAAALAEGDVEGEALEGPNPPVVVVGEGALRLGAKTPARLVASSKSWLSHTGVDRNAPILPWGAPADVPRTSPVDAAASTLRRIRQAWDATHPDAPLAAQDVVLTVPASFDEGARQLTLEAARRAGLPRPRLLEEPTAAFHHFLHRHGKDAESVLAGVRLVLVVDVGGGTTDLTLVRVELRDSGIRLTRIAVGDHLMLGGDNVDHALARTVEARLPGGQLGAGRYLELVMRAKAAKERLLGPDAPPRATVSVLGSGSRLVAGTLSAELARDEVEALARDGFFPSVTATDKPDRSRVGIVELGLPYAKDPAITKHVVAFLARHADLAREAMPEVPEGALPVPDAVLLNGGVFHAEVLRARLLEVLSTLRGSPVRLLPGDDPDRAVAIGASAYALARRGHGVRIGGGSARSYYLVLPDTGEGRRGVCLLPRGAEEGEHVRLDKHRFALALGRPVRFTLVSTPADVRYVHPGEVVALDDTYEELPPIAAVLGEPGESGQVTVALECALSEVGTFELHCVEEASDRHFKLELQLRGASAEATSVTRVTRLHPRFAEAVDAVRAIYGKPRDDADHRDAKRLRHELERILGPRETWETPLLRELFSALLAGMKHRRRSEDHERVFFNLVGYTMRPGFGYPLDDWRVKQLAALVAQGVQFVNETQNWAELWTMLRRVAGGLTPETQASLAADLEYYVEPPSERPKPRPKGPRKLGHDEMVALVGALEHLSPETKTRLGDHLVTRLVRHGENPSAWWSVGRLGARVPAYGSVHRVVPPAVAERWLTAVFAADLTKGSPAAFAAVQLARCSGDRSRDVSEATRAEVARRLEAAGANATWVAMVREVTRLEAAEEKRIFGESLPPGLRLLDE